MNYNYCVDLTSWFLLLLVTGSLLRSVVVNLLEWINGNKGDVKNSLKNAFKAVPLLKKYFPPSRMKKAEEYDSMKNSFNDFRNSIYYPITAFCVLIGFTPFALHTIIQLFPCIHTTWHYIILIFISMVVKTAFSIPFDYYDTFTIEERFGFNRTTHKTFRADIVKEFIFSFVFMSVIVAALNYTLTNFGPFNVWGVVTLVAVFITFSFIFEFLYMTYFIRIFNSITPLKNKKLLRKINKLLQKHGYKQNMVYEMDASTRTTHSNAFIGGFGKSKKIILFDNLLKKYTDDEILSILGHELAHGKLYHLALNRVISAVSKLLTVFVVVCFMYNIELYHSFGYNWITKENIMQYSMVGFMLSVTMLTSVKWIFHPLESYISRKCEYAADRYSVMNTRKKTAMISSLIKLASENYSELFPNRYYEMWNYSHPSLLNRINAIKNIKIGGKRNKSVVENNV